MAPSSRNQQRKQAQDDDFTLISTASSHQLYPTFEHAHSAPIADSDVPFQTALRQRYAELNLTVLPTSNVDLVQYAGTGHATATLDTTTDSLLRWRGFVEPSHRGGEAALGDAVFFAKYHYQWGGEDFILFTVGPTFQQLQYILKEPDTDAGEDSWSHCAKSDALILEAGKLLAGDATQYVYVFDNYWMRSRELWEQVQQASWDKVILDPSMKHALKQVAGTFFDSKDVYQRLGVPWKRGIIFYGPPGNGKTISIKALMKTLYGRENAVPSLYVKNAPTNLHLRMVFSQARIMTPCMLVFEDIETIVNADTRSYFFNEVDGLANNDGILMVASTNYLDRLDPGLSKRPSRFDRKYLFPRPNEHERTLYCAYWREKLHKAKSDVVFPERLTAAIAHITGGFSFAYLQEAFVASLLVIARDGSEEDEGSEEDAGDLVSWFEDGSGGGGDDEDLRGYKLWRVMKKQVALLRKELGEGGEDASSSQSGDMQALQQALRELDLKFQGASSNEKEAPGGRRTVLFDNVQQGLPVASPQAQALRDGTALSSSMSRHEISKSTSYVGVDEMQRVAGVGKRQYLTERAYEWTA